MNVGVHVTHCCIIHGCKYRDDDCPVVLGTAEQDAPCEDCDSIGIRSLAELRRRLALRDTDVEEMIEAISIGFQGVDTMLHCYYEDCPGRERYEREEQYLYSILDRLYEQQPSKRSVD